MTKKILILMLALAFCLTIPAKAANIIVVTGAMDHDVDGVQDDQGLIDWLVAEGHNVDAQLGNWMELDADKIAALDAADLIIVSRASSSGDYDDGNEPTQWNSIDTPLIQMNAYLLRSSRWLWVNSTTILSLDSPIMQAVLPDHPIFDGVAIDADNIVLAIDGTVGTGQTSFVTPDDLGNGTLIAQSIDGLPWIVEFDAGVEFYAGAGQAPAAKSVIFNTGTQEVSADPTTPQGAHNLTADGEQILRNMIAYLVPVITSVVRSNGVDGDRDPIGAYDGSTTPLATEAGGLKDGNMVYSDRTYPWFGIPAEYEGTEYIRTFNSDKNGGTVDVTYTVTTSQYAIVWLTVDDRIPAEWDGGGTIASMQDAADQTTAAIAPAGTFADTGIDIYIHENDTTDRQMSVFAAELPAGAYVFSSMDSGKNYYSIGAIAAEAPPEGPAIADVTGPADVVLGVPNDGLMDGDNWGWPGAETPPLSVDNNSGTKFLHFKGELEPTGIQVTPAAGASIVTGLTFTTANDSPERDPISFELSGSNESIDGPYELIAAGDIVDFAQVDAWPRFTMNETEIAFDNAAVYKHYQVMFPTIRDAASANSMQIAEIELLGITLEAGNFSPADGAVAVGPDADLSWSAGSLAVSHDVYFGTEIPPALVGNQEGTSFDPGTLEYGTTYFWQVDEIEEDGTVRAGSVLSFTTTTPVGIFEYTHDIGGPAGIGRTTYEGYVWKNDTLSEQYLIMGGGADIWGTWDQFHYAYNMVSGDVRVSGDFEWVVKSSDWAKYGVMLRDPANDGASVHYLMMDRGLADYVGMQHREATGAGSGETGALWQSGVKSMGIQKITIEGLTWIEGLADFGDGWQSVCIKLAKNLPDEVMAGVIIGPGNNNQLVQARVTNVNYQLNPSLVADDLGLTTVPASADLGAATSDVSGFSIRSLKPLVTDGWGYDAMNSLLDTGTWMGLPAQPGTEGTRIDEFVNLRDTGNGVFSVDNGYPDKSYPGIDPLEDPAQDPAAGDDDDNFATEILGCIQLTAGLHYIGASSDDGTIIEIGGVEIGRTGEWKGTSNEDFLYQVEADGYYNFRARHLEGGGGASIELHEIFMDGTRILLNDVANGGSAVFAPAP